MIFNSVKTLSSVLLVTFLLLCASNVFAAHHKDMEPVAKSGQVVVTYRGSCPANAVEGVIDQIKSIIDYERENSPVLYSSAPGVWSDGKIGAVDLHESVEAMEKAFAWQEADKKWSSSYARIAANCGITVGDFEVVTLIVR